MCYEIFPPQEKLGCALLMLNFPCDLPDIVLQFASYEGKDKGQQSQQDVISKDATDENH